MNYRTRIIEWFAKRGKTPYEYQIETIEYILKSKELKRLIAAAPNAGKTLMSICIIDLMIEDDPTLRILVLTHNTTILRKNYVDSIKDNNANFSFHEVTQGTRVDMDKSVNIALPSTLYNRDDNGVFDFVIVDEAHEFYELSYGKKKSMVQQIIDDVECSNVILMTGTPSKFNGRSDIDATYSSGRTVYLSGNSADVDIEVVTSSHLVREKDYNTNDDLKKTYNFDDQRMTIDLNKVLEKVYDRLLSRVRNPKNFLFTPPKTNNGLIDWVFFKKNLGRTLIACRNKEQAKQVQEFFESKSIDTVLSLYDTDINSKQLIEFQENIDKKVLIVVYRGILGYSDHTLENIIDLSLTKNINKMNQFLNRATRKWGDIVKLYIKLAPITEKNNTDLFVSAMLSLQHDYWFKEYNGRNFFSMELLTVKRRIKNETDVIIENDDKIKKNRLSLLEAINVCPPEYLLNKLYNNDNKEYNPISWISMKVAQSRIQKFYEKNVMRGYWTKDVIVKLCNEVDENGERKFKKVKDLIYFNSTAYNNARKMGILYTECGFTAPVIMTEKICVERAKKYETITEFQKNERAAYKYALKHKILDTKCGFRRKQKLNGYWMIKENVLKESRKYKTAMDFRKASAQAYKSAREMGILYTECGFKRQRVYMTDEELLREGKKYRTKGELTKKNHSLYIKLHRRGLLNKIKFENGRKKRFN